MKKRKRLKNEKALEAARGLPCAACNAPPPSDPSHIKSVGAGGPDTEWNLMPMCRWCHSAWHELGWYSALTFEPRIRRALLAKGWQVITDVFLKPKLWHPNLAEPGKVE